MSRDLPLARRFAQRLIQGHASDRPEGPAAARAAAAACNHLYRELSRWVGPDGCHALFARARAEALSEHAALREVQLHARSEPYVDAITETIMAHGDAATAVALERMIVHLVELLGRLIGDDMAARLIEGSLPASERGDLVSDDRREEA